MKVELTNQELKDIYGGLTGVATEEAYHIHEMEKENKEENKVLLESIKKSQEREMILINKIAPLIDWNES